MPTYDCGVQIGAQGIGARLRPGENFANLVARPEEQHLLGWHRHNPTIRPRHQLWLLGVHGGAGVSTTQRVLADNGLVGGDASRAWPNPADAPVIVVARTHAAGIHAAQLAAQQHMSGYSPPGTHLLGCLLVPDAPGRLPASLLSSITSQIQGVYADTWVLSWNEQYRLAVTAADQEWAPTPAVIQGVITSITEAIESTTDQKARA